MGIEELTEEQKKKAIEDYYKKIKGEQQPEGEGKAKIGEITFSTKGMYQSIFNQMLAARYGEKWQLSPAELDGISKATDTLLIKYAPLMAKWGAEINFGFWLFLILSPRLEYPKEARKEAPEEKKEPEKPEEKKGV